MGIITMNEKEILRLEVFNNLSVRRLSQPDVANLLSISKRQVKRLSKRYKSQGAKGLASKKRGKRSNNRLSEDLKNQAIGLISEKYEDFGPTFAHEKLVEQKGLRLSVTSTRNLMIDRGIWISKKSKKKRVFQMRERRPREGEIVQVDGSDHLWFENRGKRCTLLVYIDDATSSLKELRFVESESIFSYYKATKSYLKKHGRPLSFYTDKHSVFRVNREGALSGTGLTQFGHEKLVEQEGLRLSVTSTRNLMIDRGIWIPKKSKKKRVFQMRERRPREGEIIQVDGSDHLWFENRGKRGVVE